MEDIIKKRKRLLLRPPSLAVTSRLVRWVLAAFLLATSLFFFFISSRHHLGPSSSSSAFSFSFRRRATALSLLSNSLVRGDVDDADISLAAAAATSSSKSLLLVLPELRILNQVLFPDHVLVILRKPQRISNHQTDFDVVVRSAAEQLQLLNCVYRRNFNRSRSSSSSGKQLAAASHRILSADEYDASRWMVRCPLPPAAAAAEVGLRWNRGRLVVPIGGGGGGDGKLSRWDWMTYETAVDGDQVVALVKGLNLRRDGEPNPARFSCHFMSSSAGEEQQLLVATRSSATYAAQEVVRCPLPEEVKTGLAKGQEITVSVVRSTTTTTTRRRQQQQRQMILPSVARLLYNERHHHRIRNRAAAGVIAAGNNINSSKYKFELCGCTMTWNQASQIREWVIYHAWLGVQRWFIYDNNSDDGLKTQVEKLDSENYNVTRHVWPWIKTQEAGFSHCVLRAKAECKWVAFFDVDEFYYLPKLQKDGITGRNSLLSMITTTTESSSSSSSSVGEIRTRCHSFGPSGLTSAPSRGVTVGYTCRLLLPERHKSIVRPEAVDDSLGNVVHHFKLKHGFRFTDWPEGKAVINHYKYQVWDVFKAKFLRRVSTYVADWTESQNENSRDRAPGLGTEAVEPRDWRLRFCQVWDNGLRDFVVAGLAHPITGLLPWQIETTTDEEVGFPSSEQI